MSLLVAAAVAFYCGCVVVYGEIDQDALENFSYNCGWMSSTYMDEKQISLYSSHCIYPYNQ